MARFFGAGGGGTPFVLSPVPRALVVDKAAAATAPDGAYSGDQAFNTFTAALAAVPDGGSIQIAGGDYKASEPPVTVTDKSFAVVCLGARAGTSPAGNRMDARLPDLNWNAAGVERMHFFKCSVDLLGTDQVAIGARDSVIDATAGVGSLASYGLSEGLFTGHADNLNCYSVGVEDTTCNAGQFEACEISGNLTATVSATFTNCTFPFAITITCPSIFVDSLSYANAAGAGVTFSSPPVLLDGSDGIENQSLVNAGAGNVSDALNALMTADRGMLPIWCATTTGNAVAADRYLYPGASETAAGATSANQSSYIVGAPVTIVSMYAWFATVAAVPLAAADCTFRVRKNGVDIPGCTCTIPATTNFAFVTGLSVPLIASDFLQCIMQTTAADGTVVRPRVALGYTTP